MNSETTHIIKLTSFNVPRTKCVICFSNLAKLSFNFNCVIVTLCRLCSHEFVRLTFERLYPYHFNGVNERTIPVYIFFRDFIFSPSKRQNADAKPNELTFFKNPLFPLIKDIDEGKRLSALKDISQKRLRLVKNRQTDRQRQTFSPMSCDF